MFLRKWHIFLVVISRRQKVGIKGVVRNETRQPECNPTALRGGPREPSDFTALCYAAAGEGASFGRLLALRAKR